MGPDKALLVDKLVKSRKDIAKRDEKVEFLEEHIRQLTEELTKEIQVSTCVRVCARVACFYVLVTSIHIRGILDYQS